MFHHVTILASDRAASEEFYETVLGPLGISRTGTDEHDARWHDLRIVQAAAGAPPTRGLHLAFAAPSRAHVDRFWEVGTRAGFEDDGAPGPRREYGPDYYGSFLRDPDGNSAEAVHHGSLRAGGVIDHLWIRVADVPAAKRFYETIAEQAGFGIRDDTPERVQFAGAGGSFSLVSGTPTEHARLGFVAPAPSERTDPDGNVVELVARH